MRCIILDLEATGLNPDKGDVIIDVAAVRVGPDGIEERFQTLVHPGNVAVSPFIEAMTGISNSMLQDAPALRDVLPGLRDFIGDDLPILGHNIGFDANFLGIYGLPIAADRLVDTCDFATIYFPKAPSHSLEVLSTYLDIQHTEKHRAMGDVLATYELLRRLVTARDQAPAHMQQAAVAVQAKAQAWGGNRFFALQTPLQEASFPTGAQLRDPSLHPGAASGHIRYQLQPNVQRTIQWALVHHNPVVLVPPADAESYRDLVLTENAGVYLDHAECFLDPQRAQEFLARDTWTAEEALFALRLMSLAPRDAYVHQNALAISHRERSLFAAFAAREDMLPSILAQQDTPLFLTYAAWHKYKDMLPKDRLWIIPDAMRLELYLHQSSKMYLSMDAALGRLKSFAQRCENDGFKAMDLHDSMEHIVRYAFGGLTKLLRHDQRELVLEETPELLQQFVQVWQKGTDQWAKRVAGAAPLEKQCEQLNAMVVDFTARITDLRRITTLCRMNQGILLQQELRSLQDEHAWFMSLPACHMLQGYMDDRFPLFLRPQETMSIDALDLSASTFHQGRSSLLAEEFAALPLSTAQAILAQGARHTMFCTGSGAALDKVFDQLFDSLHGESLTVLSSGKTGGRGKVRYNFAHNPATLLVATPQDAKGLGVPADTLVITSLPFPPVMSSYWTATYGENTFGTLTMPLMIQQIVDMVWAAGPLQLYITDARLFEKKYGQEVMTALAAILAVS